MALRSSSDAFTNDVFLSFRGSDTRLGFFGNLYKALSDRGIHTFIDHEKLKRGEEITPTLMNLQPILDCANGKKGLLVLPGFHNMDPSDVRRWKGSYGEALAKHEERAGYEYEFIGKIVERVSSKINHATLYVADHPVGLESQVLEVRKLLDDRSDDGVQMIGIHRMGGVEMECLREMLKVAVHAWCPEIRSMRVGVAARVNEENVDLLNLPPVWWSQMSYRSKCI
ncbi:hypothetical protein JHK82_054988 [Glycine max]|nr:hypothetical protein JHK86_054834 [Glycine max]KAG5073627.1 hypothetical protein JHK84_054858 [Glycine max]KAG5076293.1 hypothetical protein JHK82_054988 [Glycine max]